MLRLFGSFVTHDILSGLWLSVRVALRYASTDSGQREEY